MKIFSHRGYTKRAAENSLASIRSALEIGCSVELDVRVTADGHFVLNHDPVIPSKNGKIEIRSSSINVIKEHIRRNNSPQINTLKEALNLFAREHKENTEIALHIKSKKTKNIEKKLLRQILSVNENYDKCNLLSEVFVFDVTIEKAKTLKKIEPSIRVGVSVGESEIFNDGSYPTIYEYEKIRESVFDIVWADEWKGGLYERNFFERCKSDGYIVYCVSPELHSKTNPSHPKSGEYYSYWDEIIEKGAHGICTDYPKLFIDKYGLSR